MTAEQFLEFAHLLPECLLLVTGEGVVVAANRAAERRLQCRHGSLVECPLKELVDDSPEKIGEYLALCARTRERVLGAVTVQGTPHRCEGWLARPRQNGDPPLLLLRVAPRSASAEQFVALNERIEQLNREVARRKQVERQLDEERQWLRVTLLSIGDAVVTTDADARVQLMNHVAESLTGWTQAEAYRRSLTEIFRIVNETTRQSVDDPVRKVLHDGRIVGLANHTVLIRRDGTERPIDDCAAPIHRENGTLGGVVLVFRDVTERRRVERELHALNESLERRVAERTAIAEQRAAQLQALAAELTQVEQRERRRLAVVLHDSLQQLIVAAKMRLSMARARGQDPLMREALEEVDDLLQQSIETSRSLAIELAPPVLYDAGLAAALEWLGRWMEDRLDLTVQVEIGGDREPEKVETSAFLLHAVRELLLNVVKHSGVREARVRMSNPAPAELELAVADAGAGFDPAVLQQNRGDRFGLFSIRERLERLGGRMDIETAPGRGTQIRLLCPVEVARVPDFDQDAAAAALPSAGEEMRRGATGRTRVLLVDDHRIVRQGLRGLLEGQPDIEVVGEAADGQQAIEQARQLRPDVIVMDIAMPGMNGIEATRRISAEMPDMRTIGLSLHERDDMARAMLDAGAAAYLSKGGPSEDLIAAIRAVARPRSGV